MFIELLSNTNGIVEVSLYALLTMPSIFVPSGNAVVRVDPFPFRVIELVSLARTTPPDKVPDKTTELSTYDFIFSGISLSSCKLLETI